MIVTNQGVLRNMEDLRGKVITTEMRRARRAGLDWGWVFGGFVGFPFLGLIGFGRSEAEERWGWWLRSQGLPAARSVPSIGVDHRDAAGSLHENGKLPFHGTRSLPPLLLFS